jgi:hypothetical protein
MSLVTRVIRQRLAYGYSLVDELKIRQLCWSVEFVCLCVCLSVCVHATVRNSRPNLTKPCQSIRDLCRTPLNIFRRRRSKVKVKVTQKVKNTYFGITSVLIIVSTSNKVYIVALVKAHLLWSWPWPLTLTLKSALQGQIWIFWWKISGRCIFANNDWNRFKFGTTKLDNTLTLASCWDPDPIRDPDLGSIWNKKWKITINRLLFNRFVPNLTWLCTILYSMTMTSLVRIGSGIRNLWGFFVLNGIFHYKLRNFTCIYLFYMGSCKLGISLDIVAYCVVMNVSLISGFNRRSRSRSHTRSNMPFIE